MLIEPMRPGEDLEHYCASRSKEFHGDTVRHDGTFVFEGHILPVVRDIKSLVLPHKEKIAGSAGYLHDSPEDTGFVEVVNPFAREELKTLRTDLAEMDRLLSIFERSPDNADLGNIFAKGNNIKAGISSNLLNPLNFQKRRKDIVYVNQLLKNAREEGEQVCYIVNRVTRRPGLPKYLYITYSSSVFALPSADSPHYGDAIVASILKLVDSWKNATSKELVHWCSQYESAEEIKSRRERMVRQAKALSGIARVKGNAQNNIGYVLPQAEYVLLGHVKDGGGVFNPEKLEAYMRRMYVYSFVAAPCLDPRREAARIGALRDLDDKLSTLGRKSPILSTLGKEIKAAKKKFAASSRMAGVCASPGMRKLIFAVQ